jgi:uncharacterized membrane protein YkoI
MKYLAFIIAVASTFTFSSVSQAGPKEKEKQTTTAPLAEPKITRKDAEHAVLFQYRGANIEKIELVKGKNYPNWRVDVFQAGGRSATQVMVDGMTGKIVEGDVKGVTAPSSNAPSHKGGMGY